MRRVAALCLWLATLLPAAAEDLVVLMSTQDVAITSTYSGARVAVFGMIERDASTLSRGGKYDVVITVAGPSASQVLRAKERTGPLWINNTVRRYPDVPGYYALLSTGPVPAIANDPARERQKMGLAFYLAPSAAPSDAIEATDAALFRLRKKAGLLVEDPRAVQMHRPNLFSSAVTLPASAPTGRYLVGVTVLASGVPLKTVNTSFVVRKIGFEAYVAAHARDNGLLYGLFAVLCALVIGVLGNLMFRRD